VLSARNGHPLQVGVCEDYLHVEALGAALLARGHAARVTRLPPRWPVARSCRCLRCPPGARRGEPRKDPPSKGRGPGPVRLLGVTWLHQHQSRDHRRSRPRVGQALLMTAGRPIEAIKELFRGLLAGGAAEIAIRGWGHRVRPLLVGSFIGADLVKNEITAQTRAAAEIDPDADIIELGARTQNWCSSATAWSSIIR